MCRGKTNCKFMISGFRHDADKICALLGYNVVSSGNPLPMFQDNISVPSARVKKSHQYHGRSLNSRTVHHYGEGSTLLGLLDP
jgi:hypothetical protein